MSVLTPRQVEILQLVGEGLTDRQIGERLHITEGTVGTTLRRVFRSLDVQSRHQAVMVAYRAGVIR